MSVSVSTYWKTRATAGHGKDAITLQWTLWGSNDEQEVLAALLASSSLTYYGLIRRTRTVEPLGGGKWRGTVNYSRPESQTELTTESLLEVDTTGGTQHITHSLGGTTYDVVNGGAGVEVDGGPINVQGESVQGVDIYVPGFEFSERHILAAATHGLSYWKTVASLSGTMNASAFRGFAAGEVLFIGARGRRSNEEDFDATFRFSALPNSYPVIDGRTLSGGKLGWDYLWVSYVLEEDTDKKKLMPKADWAYVERVYPQEDFSQLDIG